MIHPPVMTEYVAKYIAKIIVNRWRNAGYRNIKLIDGVWYPSKEHCNVFDMARCIQNCLMNGIKYNPDANGLLMPVLPSKAA